MTGEDVRAYSMFSRIQGKAGFVRFVASLRRMQTFLVGPEWVITKYEIFIDILIQCIITSQEPEPLSILIQCCQLARRHYQSH